MANKRVRTGNNFSPVLCVTHMCNLDCVYCYQKHDPNHRMSFETACACINDIFSNIPDGFSGIDISFIGGEPLLEFELIQKIIQYTKSQNFTVPYIFYATTNGTVLTPSMKRWLVEHKEEFVLGLSLDGIPEVHNKNRCNSFDKIDTQFFLDTWPNQGVKMTLSECSLEHLAESIIYLHSLGFKEINGVNLFEGTYDWSDPRFISVLIPQLKELVSFYVEHDDLTVNQMLNRSIAICEEKPRAKKNWCGIGISAVFYDTDGKRLPCPFITPMTFSQTELEEITKTDFENVDEFVDDNCFKNCYIFPVCPNCAGANYLTQKTFKIRDKTKCQIQKLITLYSADLIGKRILKNPNHFQPEILVDTINAIEKIRSNFLNEFADYFDIM